MDVEADDTGDVDVDVVLEVLREVGPHGVRDDPRTAGVDAWTYFVGRDCRRRDFSGIEHGLSISFERADLRQADLRGVLLHGAVLREADLRGADARSARMDADLGRARLEGLRLDGAQLRCRFTATRPDLAASSVSGSTFVDVDLSWTRFTGGSFDAELTDCVLTGFVGLGASVSGTWTRCELSDVLLRGARAVSWVLVESHGEALRVPAAALDSVEMLDCRLPGMVADEADLGRSIIVGSHLDRASLRSASLDGADLERVSLVEADLRGADLTGASFDQVDLTGASLDDGALDALASVRDVIGP